MKKITMTGMDVQYINLIHESVKICDAVKEFIDNAIDANATKIEVANENGIFSVKDNSPFGMVDSIEKFAESYKSHIASKKGTIGIKGVGAKDAILRLSDFFGKGSVITIITSNGKIAKKLTWNLCEITKSINDIFVDEIDFSSVDVGTTIMISNSMVTTQIMTLVRKSVAYAYAFKMKFEGLNIFFKEAKEAGMTKIEPTDFFYLDKLCGEKGENLDRIKTQGNYECDGFFFIVRQNVFRKIGTKEEIIIPTINLFISENAERDSSFDDGRDAYNDAKFGEMLYGRYISQPTTSQKIHFKKTANTGGAWRCRTLVMVNENTYDILSGKSNKSKGVSPLQSNTLLKEYEIVLDNDICNTIRKMYMVEDNKGGRGRKMNPYEVMELQYLWLSSLNTKRKSGQEITLEDVLTITSKKQAQRFTIKEECNKSITENAIYLTLGDNERKMVCLFEKCLKENKVDNMKKAKILNSLLESYCTA